MDNLQLVLKLAKPYQDMYPKEEILKWFSNPLNILLREEDNVALFTYDYDKVYSGHYLFNSAKGRKAITLGRKFLREIFEGDTPIEVIKGFTPVQNKPACWVSRQIGFKSQGIIDYNGKECEFFIVTRKEVLN